MITHMVITALAALLISLFLTRIMITFAPKLGLMDQPGERRIHHHAIPRAGGIAIWISFLIVAGLGHLIGWKEFGNEFGTIWFFAFLASSFILVVVGIIDDLVGLPAWTKLGAHISASVIFFLLNPMKLGLFEGEWVFILDLVVFTIWAVVLINAFNLIDGLDGLCGGLAAIASFSLSGIAMLNGRVDAAILLLIMGSAVCGFLRYNLNPAKIFLGDAGSMLLGFFLATAATDAVGKKAIIGIILLPIAIAGVPLLDVLLAIWRRGARRVSEQLAGHGGSTRLFQPDRDHLHHRLLDSSGSQHRVAVLLHGLAVMLSVIAFLPMILGDRVVGLSIVAIIIIFVAGIRHLARVEMEQMGNVVHLAIKLPGWKRRMAATLFLYDLMILISATFLAILLETNFFTRGASLKEYLIFIVTYTCVSSFSLLVARVHRRLWVRATMRDLVSLNCWLLIASLLTFIFLSIAKSEIAWSSLRLSLISYVFSSLMISLPRVTLDLLRDFGLEARSKQNNPLLGEGFYGTCVILGAGDLGSLLLDHLKSSVDQNYPGLRLIGFLDENTVIHGRNMRNFPIFGNLQSIPNLIKKDNLKTIIVAIKTPRPELISELELYEKEHSLNICHWSPHINLLDKKIHN